MKISIRSVKRIMADLQDRGMIIRKGNNRFEEVVAFANGIGGKIIFGVEDKTGKIVGVDRESIFQTMDAITNAISDSCEPRIIPDVTVKAGV